MSEWLAMGGYGAYVWPSYGIFLAVVVVNAWYARRAHREARRAARRRIERVTERRNRG